jgi:hypothetical protein
VQGYLEGLELFKHSADTSLLTGVVRNCDNPGILSISHTVTLFKCKMGHEVKLESNKIHQYRSDTSYLTVALHGEAERSTATLLSGTNPVTLRRYNGSCNHLINGDDNRRGTNEALAIPSIPRMLTLQTTHTAQRCWCWARRTRFFHPIGSRQI